jgi:hypothetical protein
VTVDAGRDPSSVKIRKLSLNGLPDRRAGSGGLCWFSGSAEEQWQTQSVNGERPPTLTLLGHPIMSITVTFEYSIGSPATVNIACGSLVGSMHAR